MSPGAAFVELCVRVRWRSWWPVVRVAAVCLYDFCCTAADHITTAAVFADDADLVDVI